MKQATSMHRCLLVLRIKPSMRGIDGFRFLLLVTGILFTKLNALRIDGSITKSFFNS
jgi:hypothetical protein